MQLIDGTYAMADNVEEFSRLRRAVNEANWESSVTIVYTISEEEKVRNILANIVDYFYLSRSFSSNMQKNYKSPQNAMIGFFPRWFREKPLPMSWKMAYFATEKKTTRV